MYITQIPWKIEISDVDNVQIVHGLYTVYVLHHEKNCHKKLLQTPKTCFSLEWVLKTIQKNLRIDLEWLQIETI